MNQNQQKQTTAPDVKTATGMQSTQPQQQKGAIPQGQDNKQSPAGGYPVPPTKSAESRQSDSKPPLPHQASAPTSGGQKIL